MNCDIIYIIKTFLPTKDLYYLELTNVLYYSTTIPLYKKELRIIARQWPISKNVYYTFIEAIRCKFLNAAQYLVKTYEINSIDALYYYSNTLCRDALISKGVPRHVDVLIYLVETFQLTKTDMKNCANCVLCYATENGHFDVGRYLKDQFQLSCAYNSFS